MNNYINDAFTREGENTNLEINNLNVGCITSTNNKFELDSNGNLTVKSITAESIITSENNNETFNPYPIGSIYLSVNGVNPSTLFGGVWEQIRDRFLLACGDEYTNGGIGGEKEHTLTLGEMPNHTHSATTNTTGAHRHGYNGWWTFGTGNKEGAIAYSRLSDGERYDPFNSNGEHSHTVTVNASGDGQAHNNMPPYLAVYVWKRIS